MLETVDDVGYLVAPAVVVVHVKAALHNLHQPRIDSSNCYCNSVVGDSRGALCSKDVSKVDEHVGFHGWIDVPKKARKYLSLSATGNCGNISLMSVFATI